MQMKELLEEPASLRSVTRLYERSCRKRGACNTKALDDFLTEYYEIQAEVQAGQQAASNPRQLSRSLLGWPAEQQQEVPSIETAFARAKQKGMQAANELGKKVLGAAQDMANQATGALRSLAKPVITLATHTTDGADFFF